ncbi:MAG: glycoside hydrolase 43 family protein [Prevotella sp.]|nr:glycoside hydrolase 43 family protein [Prevotella sp.]
MRKKQIIMGLAGLSLALSATAQTKSNTWNPNVSKTEYRNPIINADYSDPDVCRVGNDYYMTSSSFNCFPGLQVLHSTDLVNWEIIGAALEDWYPGDEWKEAVQHGNAVWAPSIRYHNGEFYIYWGDPDRGLFMVKTKDPRGHWEKPVLVKEGLGMIDCCPLWDDDGRAWLSHGCAGSRAGVKSVLFMTEMTPDGKSVIGSSRIIYDGHDTQPTIEGTKLYKRNGYYYIMSPAGGVPTGWQVVLRSKDPFGPYEERVVMAQGKNTLVNGPHQGAWVDTQNGEDWFLHFQDKDAYGRVVHLQPVKWVNDWPVIGVDTDGDGVGEPVNKYKKPNLPSSGDFQPAESDDFTSNKLGLQWQWHGLPSHYWAFSDANKQVLRLYSVENRPNYKNLSDCPNLLLQKMPAEDFTVTAKVKFTPNPDFKPRGENCGLVVMGQSYVALKIVDTKDGFELQRVDCKDALKGTAENVVASVKLPTVKGETPYTNKYLSTNGESLKFDGRPSTSDIYLRVVVKAKRPKAGHEPQTWCTLQYSTDGKKFTTLGDDFRAVVGKWIGAKVGLFCCRPGTKNDGGWMEVDWVHFDK